MPDPHMDELARRGFELEARDPTRLRKEELRDLIEVFRRQRAYIKDRKDAKHEDE